MSDLSLTEVLEAMQPCWRFANETDDEGRFVRPDYRRALDEVWLDLVLFTEQKRKRQPNYFPRLNVAVVRLPEYRAAAQRDLTQQSAVVWAPQASI